MGIACTVLEQPALEPRVEHRLHEQGVAARSLPEHSRKTGWWRLSSEAHGQVILERLLAQGTHREFGAETADAQPRLELVDRVVLRSGVAAPVGADHEQPRLLAPARQRLEKIDRRGIAPVQVLEHEHER